MNRLMRACCDLGDKNPIISVHDQGAGGNGNVLKEIVEPAGAEYDIRKVLLCVQCHCMIHQILITLRPCSGVCR
jgi:phosphoribosylformylglycinamidine (FGAM) synthase-like enzyme